MRRIGVRNPLLWIALRRCWIDHRQQLCVGFAPDEFYKGSSGRRGRLFGAFYFVLAHFFDQRGTAHVEHGGGARDHVIGLRQGLFNQRDFDIG